VSDWTASSSSRLPMPYGSHPKWQARSTTPSTGRDSSRHQPENILLHDGSALIADFGIALAASQTDGSARLTETGMSLGTPTYMSPEQAMGERTLDARTDVYALGCVLYEALVGEPPFTGPTAQSIVARVMTEAPRDLAAQRSTVPRNVSAATAVALAKLPADRFSSAAAFAAALANPSFGLVENASAATPPSPWTPRRIALTAGGAAVALVAGVLLGAGTATTSAPTTGIVVSAILPPAGEDFGDRRSFALSPDGQRLAFVALSERGESHLWIRDLASLHAERIAGTSGASAPFWSPDSRAIAFFASDLLRRLDLESGTLSTLCVARQGTSGSWGAGNLIVIATERGLERLRADRAECEVAIAADDGYRYMSPSLVDDGPTVLFDRGRFTEADSGSWDSRFSVVIGDLDAGTVAELIPGAWTPTFVAPDLVLYARITPSGNPVFAQRINRGRTRLEGDPVKLTETVRSTDLQFSYSASAGGTLTYLPSQGDPEKLLVDRRGIVLDTVRQRDAYTHTVANTRRWVALSTGLGLWVYDLDRNTSTPLLTTELGRFSFDPVWSPDDAALAFGLCSVGRMDSLPAGIHVLPLDRCRRATHWSADGRYLIVEVGLRHSTRAGIVAWDIDQQQRVDLFEFTGVHSEARVSPDGRWIAYVSAETGTPEVYVRPFMSSGRTVRLTSGGARSPRWRADGREFFYQTADGRVMSVPLPPGADIASVVATTLFRAPEYARTIFLDRGTTFDVTADGQQFVVRMTASANHAVLVQNWRAVLGAR
jgi:eukaryotic-like serine/threonine-protein kinase